MYMYHMFMYMYCREWFNSGARVPGMYYIDPTGRDKTKEMRVKCMFTNEEIITEVSLVTLSPSLQGLLYRVASSSTVLSCAESMV